MIEIPNQQLSPRTASKRVPPSPGRRFLSRALLGKALWVVLGICLLLGAWAPQALGAASATAAGAPFPRALADYPAAPGASLMEVLIQRVRAEPFNLVATLIFILAIVHTFLAPLFIRLSHRVELRHRTRMQGLGNANHGIAPTGSPERSILAEILHFFGEVEVVFGIWVIPLFVSIAWLKGWGLAKSYVNHQVSFTEPMFVVVIMVIAASRPVMQLAEQILARVAALGGGTTLAWWLSILTVAPLLGSFITEPAAMTISALLLAQKFYELKPPARLAYATLGLLFVNISVGGTLTHFAAPPVLMVAGTWGWDIAHMATHFGWKAAVGILVANSVYGLFFWRDIKKLRPVSLAASDDKPQVAKARPGVPLWITSVHVFFLIWTVMNSHYPVMFVGGFLFYLAFTEASEYHQDELQLRPALLVGFFLAGLVLHGGLQGWWIEPVLTRLTAEPLFFSAIFLTAFNDNAAITYLASLVPGFSPQLQYAVVAGAVTGGGLTVIANAPNPAGQSILGKYFADAISPLYLLLGALVPTLIMAVFFLVFR